MADALLTLDALRYDAGGRTLIDDVSLRIEAGRRTLILGPNGAGKSVLMRLMHGLIEPTAGRILWNGGSGTPVQAMVFQRPVMLRRSVLDNVTYALALAGMPSAERRRRALDVLERVGLRIWRRARRACCPAASSSAWRWRVPGRCVRACCFSTNRLPASIRGPARSRAPDPRHRR
jgi:ABC-type taurine transport system ATPase subunit